MSATQCGLDRSNAFALNQGKQLFGSEDDMDSHELEHLTPDDVVLDAVPDEVEATVQVRDAWLRSLRQDAAGLEFIVSDVRRWSPGQKVRVAFIGGNTALHQDIADATKEITETCNIGLDFGLDPQTGRFRTWSAQDAEYAAEIRVRFDLKGYFSLVGTDSIDPNIGAPMSAVGGRPGQCSLNLGGFAVNRPQNWRGVARHEFLHALAFLHSHQNMRGPCELAFRWEDDEGYVPSKNEQGGFIADAAGRRPGIYTYLAGFPNFWDKAKVDHNLRTKEDPTVVAGPFDRASVMLYRFPALFYKNAQTECAPLGDGISLSEGDRRGLRLLYPKPAAEIAAIVEQKQAILGVLEGPPPAALDGLETSQRVPRSIYARDVARLVRRTLPLGV